MIFQVDKNMYVMAKLEIWNGVYLIASEQT